MKPALVKRMASGLTAAALILGNLGSSGIAAHAQTAVSNSSSQAGQAKQASTLAEAAQEVVRRIVVMLRPGPVSVTFENRSSVTAAQQDSFRNEINNALRNSGFRLVVRSAAAFEVKVTLAENQHDYVFLAQLVGSPQTMPTIVTLSRPNHNAAAAGNKIVLRARKLIELDGNKAMLDFAESSNHELIVLQPERVVFFSRENALWQQPLVIEHQHAFPRDVRGRLLMAGNGEFDVFLPGTQCHATRSPAWALNCHDSDDPWVLTPPLTPPTQRAFYNSARNLFTGVLVPAVGEQPGRFFAAVQPSAGDWVFAAADGSIKEIKSNAATVLDPPDWGSDLALIRNSCNGANVLTSGAGDYTSSDTLRAYDWTANGPVRVSDALEFPGPITAMWSAAENATVSIIVKNLNSGKYEGYSVTATCVQ